MDLPSRIFWSRRAMNRRAFLAVSTRTWEARKAEFEKHGLTLLGEALNHEEIDRIL
jgi:hypothetical protein